MNNYNPNNTANNVTITHSAYTAPGVVTYRWTITNGVCAPSESDVRVVFDPAINVTATLAGCSFTAADSNIVVVTGTGGTGSLTFGPPSTDELRVNIDANNKAYSTPGTGGNRSYTVSDAFCSQTGNVTVPAGHPIDIPFTASNGNTTADCYDQHFNKWLTFRDGNQDAILAINDNNQDLGQVSVTVYKDNVEADITETAGSNTCSGNTYKAMRRHYRVTSTAAQPFSSSVGVRLYFSDAELQSLITASNANNVSGDPCSKNDDINSLSELYVTKYSGINEDGDYNNNDVNGIYKVYGNPTALPTQPDGPLGKTANGFAALYSGGQNHHYVELNVTEFSELWLHGSQNGTPLPVEMLYIEAQAMDNAYIQVRWATAVEIDNSGFQVERSTNGQDWEAIGWVDGHNTTTVQQTYSFDDRDVQPQQRYYYRLKQIDNDGDYEYTGIVSAILQSGVTFQVKDFVPNPAMDRTELIISSDTEAEVQLDLYNGIGQKVIGRSITLSKGMNRIAIATNGLAAGNYTGVVSNANEVYSKKLVVVK